MQMLHNIEAVHISDYSSVLQEQALRRAVEYTGVSVLVSGYIGRGSDSIALLHQSFIHNR